ncbi:MAG: NAD(+)/NADH kinase [Clostridia bacterium]|nr:NAD(+)/NADH kinase [Clostridia bacterium]
MHLCFAANPKRTQTIEVEKRLMRLAQERGFDCSRLSDGGGEGSDILVVIGGDGSLIHNAGISCERGLPMLGVHFGRVGFLSECREEDFSNALDLLREGRYTLDSRRMMACSINGGAKVHCLNDVLLFKHSFSGVAEMELSIDGEAAGTIFGDGIVVATPTGATAYSLSAGGPIIADGLDAVVITPICPHTLHMRPIVASCEAEICLQVKGMGMVAADGTRIAEVHTGDKIMLGSSDKTVSFVRFAKRNLFFSIQQKLR